MSNPALNVRLDFFACPVSNVYAQHPTLWLADQPAFTDHTDFQSALDLVEFTFQNGGEKGIRTLDRLFIGRRFQNAFLVYPGSLQNWSS